MQQRVSTRSFVEECSAVRAVVGALVCVVDDDDPDALAVIRQGATGRLILVVRRSYKDTDRDELLLGFVRDRLGVNALQQLGYGPNGLVG